MTILFANSITTQRAFSEEATEEVVISSDSQKKESTIEKQALDAAGDASKVAIERTNETMKSALSVVQEVEGVAYLAAPSNTSLANGTKILFVRRRGPRLEPISQGQVIGEETNPKTKVVVIKVQLDRDATTKYPQTGDRAVLMANEMSPIEVDPKESHDIPEVTDEKKNEDHLPGYLEFGMGMLMSGKIDTTTSAAYANTAKKSSGYRFKTTHFAYYSDFFPVGIEYDSHSGDFPTSTYEAKIVSSSESVSWMSFNYRFKKIFGKLAPRLRAVTLTDDFKTNAVDGALLSTKTSGLGFGGRLDYEFASPIWKPAKNDLFITLQSLQVEFTYFPSITAQDQGLSRGTSSTGSSGMMYGAQLNALIWLDFIPLVKRWVVQAGYQSRSYSLKFQGPTVSEPSCAQCVIAQNGTSTEKETNFQFFIGFRLDDPIRMMFPDKNKKKENP